MYSIRRIATASARTSWTNAVAIRAPCVGIALSLARASNSVRPFSVSTSRYLSQTSVLLDEHEKVVEESFTSAESEGREDGRPRARNTVLVANVRHDTTLEELQKAFSRFGHIVNSKTLEIVPGKKNIHLLRFRMEKHAQDAIAGANQTIYQGRCIFVEPARTQLPATRFGQATNTLYFGGLPFDATDEDLTAFFQQIDENMVSLRIAANRQTGKLAGYAHATFTTPEAATAAREKMFGAKIGTRALWIDFAENRSQSERQREALRKEMRDESSAAGVVASDLATEAAMETAAEPVTEPTNAKETVPEPTAQPLAEEANTEKA